MSKPGGKGSKAVAGAKGAAAEGRDLQTPPGQPENIRLTVAFAERYGLIAKLPDRPAHRRGARGVSDYGSCAMQAAIFVAVSAPSARRS